MAQILQNNTSQERNTLINRLEKQLIIAISKYGEENIDIVLNADKSVFEIMYHSEHNSFSCSDEFSTQYISQSFIDTLCNKYDCGCCY